MRSKFPFPTLVFAIIACLLVILAPQFFAHSSSHVHAQGQAQTGEQTQANEVAQETLTFKGSFGAKTLLFNVFPNGMLIVSPGRLSFECDANQSCSFCGDICRYSGTLDCSQFVSASVDGSAIRQIGAGKSHPHNVNSYRFNAASPAQAASALEAIQRVCGGSSSNSGRRPASAVEQKEEARQQKEAARETAKRRDNSARRQKEAARDAKQSSSTQRRAPDSDSMRPPTSIVETRISQPSPPTGFYAENRSEFDTLDGVTVNPSKGTLALFGHRTGSDPSRSAPYLDYLAAALESNNPTFSLEWTPESRQSVDRAFNMADQELTNRLAGTIDKSGHLTKRGEWWYRMFGVNVHEGMDKINLWMAVFPAAGYPDAGKVMKAVDEVERAGSALNQKVMDPDGHKRSPFDHLVNATSSLVVNDVQNFLNTYAAALNGDDEARETLFSWVFRGLARAYKLDENRYTARYQSLKRSGNDFGTAMAKTLEMAQDDTVELQQNAFHALVGTRTFVHIPPNIMRDVLGVNPVVVPVYEGLSANSLLARVAFESDVFGKNLMDMPEIKSDVPGYRTYFEWRQTVDRAPAAEGHTWFAADGFELIESADGGTVRFGKTPIRIYMERYDRGTGSSDRKSVEDPLLKQYADELTALYEPLAAKFPVLLDLRESMKVMAIADWLKQKGIKLSLPVAGRSIWNPPAQYPGVIHMEIAVKEAPVGEVMSASGGVDFRVDKNWKLLKQRIEEQPGPPPANGLTVDFDPASGAVASARPLKIEKHSLDMPITRIGGTGAVRGSVFWLAADGRKVPIEPGSPIFLGEHIVTGPDSRLQVMLLDESVFTLGADSDMVLDEFVYDPSTSAGKVTANLVKGIFRWVTGHVVQRQVNVKVTGPTVNIGVRGTDFEFSFVPNEAGYIKLFEGKLEITETKTGVVFAMNAGQMVTLNADGTIGRPVPLPQ